MPDNPTSGIIATMGGESTGIRSDANNGQTNLCHVSMPGNRVTARRTCRLCDHGFLDDFEIETVADRPTS